MMKTRTWTRVILLSPPPSTANEPMSEALKKSFTDRDWYPIEHHDPYEAFTELCIRSRAQHSNEGWGLDAIENLAFVIVSSRDWIHETELLGAIQRYVPTASIWRVEGNEILMLAQAVSTTHTKKQASAAPVTQSAPGPENTSDTEQKKLAEPLSRDEIDMLLHDEGTT